MRKTALIPAIAIAAGLFIGGTAKAQPPFPPGPGPGPGPGLGIRIGIPPRPPGPPPRIGIGIGIRPLPGLGIGIGIGGPAVAPPRYPPPPPPPPIVISDPVYDTYRVVYRDCLSDPWRTYQIYESPRVAHAVADQLRDMGYLARVLHD